MPRTHKLFPATSQGELAAFILRDALKKIPGTDPVVIKDLNAEDHARGYAHPRINHWKVVWTIQDEAPATIGMSERAAKFTGLVE